MTVLVLCHISDGIISIAAWYDFCDKKVTEKRTKSVMSIKRTGKKRMRMRTAGKFVAHALDRLAWIPRIMFRARHAKVFKFKM